MNKLDDNQGEPIGAIETIDIDGFSIHNADVTLEEISAQQDSVMQMIASLHGLELHVVIDEDGQKRYIGIRV